MTDMQQGEDVHVNGMTRAGDGTAPIPGATRSTHDHAHHAGHHHHHHHHHHHSHHHHHPAESGTTRTFGLAVGLNLCFVVAEFVLGWVANSTALLADAGHNLSDVLGLLLAWIAAVLARRPPRERYTYGLRSTSILAALFNAMLLLVACGAIALEAANRLFHPAPVASTTVMAVAAVGIVINGFSAWLFMAGSKLDLNQRGAYLHMVADAAISLCVVVAALAMQITGWHWLDPVLSLAIVAVIVVGTWGLLREALRLSVHAVPPHIDLHAVDGFLGTQRGVAAVQDLHVWPVSTTESAMTVSLVMPDGHPGDDFIDRLAAHLRQHFCIGHSTIQIRMRAPENPCALVRPPA